MPAIKKSYQISMMRSITGLALTISIAGCNIGGGGGGGGETDTTAPKVSEVSPAEDAVDVAPDTNITASFNEDMLTTSVNSSSLLLSSKNQSVSGSVSFEALQNTATFTPSDTLKLLGTYTATVRTSNTDLAGNGLTVDHDWTFTTRDGQWDTAVIIEADNYDADSPTIAFDNSGNALAVWEQENLHAGDTRNNIWSNRYTTGAGWGTAELIENDDSGNANDPQVAFDSAGNAMAVWSQSDGTRHNIWSNRYTKGSGWDTAELIETDDTGNAVEPQIAVDSEGNAIAVWSQSGNIWSNRYTKGAGWGTAELIEDYDGTGIIAETPQIAFDSNGNALAVWKHKDGTTYNVWSNRFTNGSGWGSEKRIDNEAEDAANPQIAFDHEGNALAVWQQQADGVVRIWANRYTSNGSGWDTADLIENNSGMGSSPQVAFDSSGNAIAVWSQAESPSTKSNIWSNRYTKESDWGAAIKIEAVEYSSIDPQIAIDTRGNALVVWKQITGSSESRIKSNRYVSGAGWGTAELIEADTGNPESPHVAVDSKGNALAVWTRLEEGQRKIKSNRFD